MVLVINNSHTNAGEIRDVGLIPGSGRYPEEGHDSPLLLSCLDSPIDREDWGGVTVHRVKKVRHD